jgi:hypothetical protein
MPSWSELETREQLGNWVIGAIVHARLSVAIFKSHNYTITNSIQESIHGKYKITKQRRTQESSPCRPQEDESGKAEKAPRLRTRIEEAQGEEAGARSGETVRTAIGIERLAFSWQRFENRTFVSYC